LGLVGAIMSDNRKHSLLDAAPLVSLGQRPHPKDAREVQHGTASHRKRQSFP